jgi:hypothetical protein
MLIIFPGQAHGPSQERFQPRCAFFEHHAKSIAAEAAPARKGEAMPCGRDFERASARGSKQAALACGLGGRYPAHPFNPAKRRNDAVKIAAATSAGSTRS